MLVMLFQIRKHYKLFITPEMKTKHKTADTKTSIRPTLHTFNQEKPAPKYYFNKLPELEVTISSEQDIASFTNTPFIKNLALTKTITKRALIRNSVTKKKKTKPQPEQRSTHKAILNNYIDDFFSAPQAEEIQQSDTLSFLDLQISSPANDEIITVNEPSEMV